MSRPLDDKDRLLLNLLQANARMTNAELAERVSLSPSGLQKRLKKLEDDGFVKQYTAVIRRRQVGFEMLCYVNVSLKLHDPQAIETFDSAIQEMPEVLECHRMTGDFDYLLKVVVRDREHLDDFLMKKLAPMPALDRMNTSVVLRAMKETTNIDLLQ